MNFVALRMLVGDKLKYISLVAGLSFAALLITQQAAIFTGYALQTGAWIRDTSVGDLWVMDDQVEFTEDLKPLTETKLSRVRGVDGVAWAVPIYKSFFDAVLPDGTRRNVRIIGIDDATLIGGPPQIVEGSLEALRQDKAVLMDVDKASDLMLNRFEQPRPLRVGDRISLNDNEAVIVGSFRSSREFFWEPVFYTTYGRAKTLYKDRKALQYMLVSVREGQDPLQVAARIEGSTGLKALTGRQFEAQTMDWILNKTGILVNFGITILLGLIIGILIAGQTLYTFVLDNLRYFAAIKAMGAGNATIIRMVLLQVAVVGLLGYGLGLGVACITGMIFQHTDLAFRMTWHIPVIGAVGILVCSGLAALVSLARVLRLEPAVVFK
jgi:putative ABC transport system permease protein